jgi:hypothetical protein
MQKEDKLPDSTTLGQAKMALRTKLTEGATCPCCQQHAQMYSRPITSAMAAALILLYRHQLSNPGMTWFHAENFFKDRKNIPASIRGDFSKLRFWGLIQADDDSEGYYRVTTKGIDFIKGEIKVESNVKLYNNKAYGFKGGYVNIHHCLKKKFNYELLMKGIL